MLRDEDFDDVLANQLVSVNAVPSHTGSANEYEWMFMLFKCAEHIVAVSIYNVRS